MGLKTTEALSSLENLSSEESSRVWQEIGETTGIDTALQEWLRENCKNFETIDELLDSPELEALSQKQAKKLKECLKAVFNSRSVSVDNSHHEESKDFISQTILSVDERLSVNVFPLITCFEVNENNYSTEKFKVREDYVKKLCNSAGLGDVYYTDILGGINIDFEKLQNIVGVPIGVLGRIERVDKFFQQILSPDSLKSLWQRTEENGSGMYLIMPANLIASDERNFYLYFYSEKDKDYENVNPKSRAIHFIRYITQLAGSLLILLDESEATSLSTKAELKRNAANRVIEFHIGETQTGKEEVISTLCQSVPLPIKKQTHSIILQGCDKCLLSVQLFQKSSESRKVTNHSYSTTVNFHAEFQLSDILDDCAISHQFIDDYLRTFDPSEYDKIKESLERKEVLLLNGEKQLQFYSMVDFAMVICFYKTVFPASFKIVASYFENSSEVGDEKRNLWMNYMKTVSVLQTELSSEGTAAIEKNLKQNLDARSKSLQRICLSNLLGHGSVNHSISIEDLFSQAWQKRCFGPTKTFLFMDKPFPDADADVVCNAYSQTVKKLFLNSDVENITEALGLQLASRNQIIETIGELETFSKLEHTRQLLNKIKKYMRIRWEMFQEKVHQEVNIEKQRKQEINLKKLIQKARSQSGQTDTSEKCKRKPISSIDVSSKEKRKQTTFRITYQEEIIIPPKTFLAISKLSLVENYPTSHRYNDAEVSVPETFKFLEFFSGELHHMDVLRVFCIDNNKLLIVGNDCETSSFIIINASNGCTLQKQFFRRPILLCDYNTISRLLCLFSVSDEKSELVIYKVSQDFKTRERFGTLDLLHLHNVRALRGLRLQPNSDYVWLLRECGQELLKLHIKNGASTMTTEIHQSLQEVENLVNIGISTKGDCLFLYSQSGKIVPFLTHTNHLMPALDFNVQSCHVFGLPGVDDTYLATLEVQKVAVVRKLNIKGSQSALLIEETSRGDPLSQSTENNQNVSKHWIHYLYWVFSKFLCGLKTEDTNTPLKLIALSEKQTPNLAIALAEALTEIHLQLQSTKKPLYRFKPEALSLSEEKGSLIKLKSNQGGKVKIHLGDFIQKLIMLTPVQIARCDSGNFLVLREGKALLTNNVEDIFELQNIISLGLLEAVFKNWLGPIIVVSTMGKQSTGKSFLLNHIFEASFDISGTRCTDGCWITINIGDGFLFVMLDFEGLGTFERSDQDDMLLTLFNSALSSMTLYKTEKRIDRETDVLFSKFNLGIDYIKGDENLFQGSFCIIINDVASRDSKDVKSEFISKISNIIRRDKTKNFITKMYDNKFQIRPFSLFETENFYADIAQLRSDIINIQPVFKSGSSFLDTMKILLAKLTLGDFNPLTRQYVDGRIKFLRIHLENAFIFGQLGENKEMQPEYFLRDLNDKNTEIESIWQPADFSQIGLVNDMDFIWSQDGGLDGVVNMYSRSVLLQNTTNYQLWRTNLEKFMEHSLNKRIERVKTWVNKNLNFWMNKQNQDYEDSISAFLDVLNLHENRFRAENQLCDEKCGGCFLKCVLKKAHVSVHFCSTDHKCTATCEFCLEEANFCQELAGHEGRHYCKEGAHTCGKLCGFNSKNGCQRLCMEGPNHESEHKCATEIHTCTSPCSLKPCNGLCNIECTILHEVHKCDKNFCLANCCVDNCRNSCNSKDHFHGYIDLQKKYEAERQTTIPSRGLEECPSDAHFCGNEHNCSQDCSQKGFCNLSTERTEFDKDFFGKRSTFKYRKRLTNVGRMLPCLVKIPPFRTEHSGDHWCTTNTESKVHTCKTRCPQCDNLCTKPVDHDISSADVLHRTSHGNMVNYIWLSTNETFEFDNHELEAGESTEIIFCHACCIRQGRGHTHIVDCPGQCENKFSAKTDHRRHDFRKWLPDKHRQRDEIWHRDYWKLHGFENPCSEAETKAFEKCDWYCYGSGHDEQNRSYCVLGLWHDPVRTLQEANLTRGWVLTQGGHAFSCTH